MAVYASQIVARVAVEGASQAKAELEGMGQTAQKAGGMFKGAFSMFAGQAMFAGLQLLTSQIGDMFRVTMEHQDVLAQTTNVIKSMHDASGMTAQAVANLAKSIQDVTPYSDDAVQAGENMLMTFGNIGKSVFPTATQAVVDFASFMKLDVSQAALQVGKALNDPVQGVGALQREGVKLSESQKQLVKHFMDTGQTAKAQSVILKELQREFGGSAEAAGKTFGGQLEELQHHFDDMKKSIGEKIIPPLTQFVDYINANILPSIFKFGDAIGGIIQWFTKHDEAATAMKVGLAVMGGAIVGIAVPAFIAWAGAAGAAAVATIAATWPALAIGAAVGLGVAGIVLAVKHWGDITKWISGVWTESINWIGGVFSGFGTKVHDVVGAIGNAFSGLGTFVHGVWDGIVGGIRDAINWIIGAIDTFIGALDSIKINLGPIHVGLNIPQIPKLDTGGFIESTGLAVVHKGETVVPPGTSIMPSSITNATSQNSRPIVINLHMNGRQTAQALIPDLVELIRNGTGTYGL